MRMIGYARTSTADQRDGLEAQIAALTTAGVPRDRIYAEHVSGTGRQPRPELEHALKALGGGDTLAVTRLDRLARSMHDLVAVLDRIERAHAGLLVTEQALDTTSASGRLIVHVLGAVAEMEAALISERTREALAVARSHGRVGGRPRALTHRQIERARALREAGTLTMPEIAASLGVSTSTVRRALQGAA